MTASSRPHALPSTLAALTLVCGTLLGTAPAAADDGQRGNEPAAAAQPMDPSETAVHFAFDDDEMMRADEIKAAWLIAAEQGPMDRVEIEGYADSTGPERYNADLSLRRARSVRDFLVDELGIDRSALSLVAYGESYPVAPNTTAEGRAANRRVEFRRVGASGSAAGS